jgi:putative inorganic carbon (HCO3(-)) transporter
MDGVVFVAIALATAVATWRRRPWVAGALAFAIPFAAYRDVAHTTLTVEKALILGAVIGLLAGGAPVVPRSPAGRRVGGVALLLLATIALSAVHAVYLGNVVREFFKQAEYLTLAWCALTLLERVPRSSSWLVAGAGAGACIAAGLSLREAILGGAPSGLWINGHQIPRVAGPLEGPNQLAGYLEAALPILWVWPLTGAGLVTLRALGTGLGSAALVLTQSRAGLLVAIVTYAFLWRLRRDAARAAVAATALGALAGFAISAVWFTLGAHAGALGIQRSLSPLVLESQPGGGVGTRSQLWPAAIALFKRHPITGVGAGNYEMLLPTVGLHGIQTHAGSLYLQTLSEQGIVGLVALLVFAAVVLRTTFARRANPLAMAAFLAWAGLLAHQVVDDLFFFPKVGGLCWLLLGAALADAVPMGPR